MCNHRKAKYNNLAMQFTNQEMMSLAFKHVQLLATDQLLDPVEKERMLTMHILLFDAAFNAEFNT